MASRTPRYILVREYRPNPDACADAAQILVDWWERRKSPALPSEPECSSTAASQTDAAASPVAGVGQTRLAAGASSSQESPR